MSDRPRIALSTTVRRAERLSPSFVRLVLGGRDLDRFPAPEHADAYVKFVFPVPGVEYPRPLDLKAVRAQLPPEHLPHTRSITVRRWDPVQRELTVDFVVHGAAGYAGPWAAQVQPGDEALLLPPGGAYTPDPQAAWHLLAGDESALPAIAAALERIPQTARVHALVELGDDGDRVALTDSRVTWLSREGGAVGSALVPAVHALDFSDDVHAFVHGEAGFVKELRRFLRVDRHVPRERLSISGYWRVGVDDEGWRAQKPEWKREAAAQDVEADHTT